MLHFWIIGLENQCQVQQDKTTRFILYLIYFDSCKTPDLIKDADAVKMLPEGWEKKRHIIVKEIPIDPDYLILPEIIGHVGNFE